MDISILLAQVMGLFLIILAFGMFINKDRFPAILNDINQNPSILFMFSLLLLIVGLLLVTTHNIWDASWRVVITLLSWLVLFRAVINIWVPGLAISLTEKVILDSNKVLVASIINLLIGLFLCYMGFGKIG